MATTIGTLLSRVAYDLQEDSNLFNNVEPHLWTPDEMLGYVQDAETGFLKETGIIKLDTTFIVSPGATRIVDKPDGVMFISRVSVGGKPMRRQSALDLERQDYMWRTQEDTRPGSYHEDHLPIDKIELNRVPKVGSSIRFIYTQVPEDYPPYPDGYNTFLTVPDAWEPYIRWEVIAQALAKDGDGQDVQRSIFAHNQFKFGIALAKKMAKGTATLELEA